VGAGGERVCHCMMHFAVAVCRDGRSSQWLRTAMVVGAVTFGVVGTSSVACYDDTHASGGEPRASTRASVAEGGESITEYSCVCKRAECQIDGQSQWIDVVGGPTRRVLANRDFFAKATAMEISQSEALTACQLRNPETGVGRCTRAECSEVTFCPALAPNAANAIEYCITCTSPSHQTRTFTIDTTSHYCASLFGEDECAADTATIIRGTKTVTGCTPTPFTDAATPASGPGAGAGAPGAPPPPPPPPPPPLVNDGG
jgi:hypothetical protein